MRVEIMSVEGRVKGSRPIGPVRIIVYLINQYVIIGSRLKRYRERVSQRW